MIHPVDEEAKATIRGILERFLAIDHHWSKGNFSKLYSEACARFEMNCLLPQALSSSLSESPHLTMRDKDHYFVLEPPEHQRFLPFVTLHGTDDWVHFRVYVLLASFDEDLQLQGVAFRYETDEGDGGGKHDFCHAQICRRIRPNGKEVTPFWVLESDPTIPLEAQNQISLVLCMLTSIYGRKCVLGKFDRTDGKIWEQMKAIRALRQSQQK